MRRRRIGQASLFVAVVLAGVAAGRFAARGALGPPVAPVSQRPARPAALVADAQRDFGEVRQGTIVKAQFTVSNRGNHRLVVRSESAGCCGGPAEGSTVLIAPGQSAALEVKADTSVWSGTMRHVARYTTNDPEHPRLSFTLKAEVTSSASGL